MDTFFSDLNLLITPPSAREAELAICSEFVFNSPGAIVKNQAPHVNLEVNEGHEFRHLTDFINNAYNED